MYTVRTQEITVFHFFFFLPTQFKASNMLGVKNSDNFVFLLTVVSETFPLCAQPKPQNVPSGEMLLKFQIDFSHLLV